MSYQALARKWRPRRFADVVGQDHVVNALRNAIQQDRVHHAFLFSGTRGVGKTTLARSIAKVLSRPFQRISLGGVRDEVSVTVQPTLKYVLPNYHLITDHPPPIRLTFEATGGRT